LQEEVHMDQLLGFTIFGDSHLVCKLHQSPWTCFGHFSSALIQFDMTKWGWSFYLHLSFSL